MKNWEIKTNNFEKYLQYQMELKDYSKFLEDRKIKKQSIEKYKLAQSNWESEKNKILRFNKEQESIYQNKLRQYEEQLKKHENWKKRKNEFDIEQVALKNSIVSLKENYTNNDVDAIHGYCSLVLSNSEYHDDFPQEFELEYNPENKILIVDYQLPHVDHIPTLKEVKYIQTRDEFTEKHISKNELNRKYDIILYQIALRSVHELYETDETDALDGIVFNGYVSSVDPATGQERNACVISLHVNKEDFKEVNLEMVEPKACFKKLKGVGSSKLHSLTPIAPIVKMNREDSRFTDSYEVIEGMDEGYNLAAMDWEDFEQLIRELFEQVFAETGGEVKVTQASRDGGIDAVIFDPDPLRGGKIVVQAKRYTNVVGVSAVRDLYGTVMNEGANKGILVTTADYGPDAYKFADDKPIQLLNGSNLLHLLEQHGHKARIDLKEAKQLLDKTR